MTEPEFIKDERVIYTDPDSGKQEFGTVTSTNSQYVFVKYDSSRSPNGIATDPERLRRPKVEIRPGGAGQEL